MLEIKCQNDEVHKNVTSQMYVFLRNSTTAPKNEIYDVKLQNYTFPMIYHLSLGKKEKFFNNTN